MNLITFSDSDPALMRNENGEPVQLYRVLNKDTGMSCCTLVPDGPEGAIAQVACYLRANGVPALNLVVLPTEPLVVRGLGSDDFNRDSPPFDPRLLSVGEKFRFVYMDSDTPSGEVTLMRTDTGAVVLAATGCGDRPGASWGPALLDPTTPHSGVFVPYQADED